MPHKRMRWKTISFISHDDYRRVQGAWGSSKQAFGKNKVMRFEGGALTIETNIPISGLRLLAYHAGARIDFANGILWDSEPSWEKAEPSEEEEREEAERMRIYLAERRARRAK